ncbi:MAG: DegV family protein [Dehalococcoidia bacterium]|nr:DegV family protein [Dehalococcoidia bacterium]
MSRGDSERRVAIVVDSAATVPDGFLSDPLTFSVPMLIHVGDRTYRDGVDLDASDFYEMQRQYVGRTSTSAPTPGDFLAAFGEAGEVADSILCITVSKSFSSSLDSAEAASRQFRAHRPGFDLRVIDSLTAVGAQGLIAWQSLKTAETGAGLDDVYNAASDIRQRVRLLAYVDTLYYLWKGGRVPGLAHLATSLLQLKPIFELEMSNITQVARPRTAAHAASKVVTLMKDRVCEGPLHAMVMHIQAPEQADSLSSLIATEFECFELFVAEFTPVMGAHIGPGMVGVAFWS